MSRFGFLRCVLLLAIPVAMRAEAGEDFTDALNGGRILAYGKAMYVADDRKGGRRDQATPGFGGKLGGESGKYAGFSLKAAWYATSDLGLRQGDPAKTDAFMFDLDKEPYSLLGEAQLNYAAGRTALTLGRQEFFSPLINTYDYRIIPNLFDGLTLKNRDIPDTTLTLAHITRMSGLDGLASFSQFHGMAQQIYSSLKLAADGTVDTAHGSILDVSTVAGQHGVWVAGIEYEKGARYRLWNFYQPETLNVLYLESRWTRPLSRTLAAVLEAQAYRVDDLGRFRDYLAQRGLNGSYQLYGGRATLLHRDSGISLSCAFDRFTGHRNTVTVFSSWGGYPEFVATPYMSAEHDAISAIVQSRLAKIGLRVDLAALGAPGQSLALGWTRVDTDERIMANSDVQIASLLYRAQITRQWSARFSIDARQSPNPRYANTFAILALRYDY